jgi:hypothetical protein
MEERNDGTSLAALFLAQRRRVGAAKRCQQAACETGARPAEESPSEPLIRVVDHAPEPACTNARQEGAA